MRVYITPSWTNAAEGHELWCGHSPDDRKMRSHCLSNGKANIEAYSDEALGLTPKKRKPVSVFDKIVPQQARLERLQEQLKELEKERYKVDELTFHEYRAVVLKKIARQKQLLDKAMNWTDDTSNEKASVYGKTGLQNDDNGVSNTDVAPSENIKNSAIKDLTNLVAGAIILLSGLGIIQQLFF